MMRISTVLSGALVAIVFIAGKAYAETLTVHTPTVRVNPTAPKLTAHTQTPLTGNAAGVNVLNGSKVVNTTPGSHGSGHSSAKSTNEQEEVKFTFQKIEGTWTNGGKTSSDSWTK